MLFRSVFLVVIGLVLMAYEAFGDDPENTDEHTAPEVAVAS